MAKGLVCACDSTHVGGAAVHAVFVEQLVQMQAFEHELDCRGPRRFALTGRVRR